MPRMFLRGELPSFFRRITVSLPQQIRLQYGARSTLDGDFKLMVKTCDSPWPARIWLSVPSLIGVHGPISYVKNR